MLFVPASMPAESQVYPQQSPPIMPPKQPQPPIPPKPPAVYDERCWSDDVVVLLNRSMTCIAKSYYWTGVVVIRVTAHNFDLDPEKIDYIGDKQDNRITITVNGKKLDYYKLEEVEPDAGIFVGVIFLTGFSHDVDGDGKNDLKTGTTSGNGPWDGRMSANDGNTITVKFSETHSGSTNTYDAKANVIWGIGMIDWPRHPSYLFPELKHDDGFYGATTGSFWILKTDEPIPITVYDPDMNISPFARDSFFVHVYSDSDTTGFQLEVTETDRCCKKDGTSYDLQDSGKFEGEIIFTDCTPSDQAKNICTPHPSAKVFAKTGDTVIAEYTDYTLPSYLFPDIAESCRLLDGKEFSGTSCTMFTTAKILGTKTLEPKTPEESPTVEPVTAIPEWIKNNAGWWAEGQIDDSSFLQGIQFLIKEGIMVIPPTATSESSGSQGVPGWVKNNAGWWAEGQIDDSSFLQGIQYLVKEGIIKVS